MLDGPERTTAPRGWRYAIPILSVLAMASVVAVAFVGPKVLLACVPITMLVLASSSMIAELDAVSRPRGGASSPSRRSPE